MIYYQGVAMTDGLNRKNHFFPFSTVVKSYHDVWNKPMPMNLGHDRSKPIGFTKLSGIYIEPGKAYVANEACTTENKEEMEQLKPLIKAYDQKMFCTEHKEEIDRLFGMLGDYKTDNTKVAPIGQAVAVIDENIVLKVFPDLVEHINDGLIDLRLLEPVYEKNDSGENVFLVPGVYKRNEYLLFAHHYFRRSLSILNTTNEEFFNAFEELRSDSKVELKICLDLDMIGLVGTERIEFEYQYLRGPHFNDDLANIPEGVTCYENEHYDNVFSNITGTQFYWHPQDVENAFQCEELCDRENITFDNGTTWLWGCRYVHSMINRDTGNPNHLDGAIRIYTDEQILERLDAKTDIKKYGKNAEYKKLWRIDNDFSVSKWKELISTFYRDNQLIGEYFGGVDEKYDRVIRESNEHNQVLEKPDEFIPVDLQENDGIRMFFRYTDKFEIPEGRDIQIINKDEFIYQDGRKEKIIESETITLLKLLKRKGLSVRIPFTTMVDFGDMVYNFPTLACKNISIIDSIIEAINELCQAWHRSGDNRLIAFGIALNFSDDASQLSFAGHVSDFVKLFNECPTPSSMSWLEWVDMLYQANNTFKEAENNPNKFLLIHGDMLCFERKIIPPEQVTEIEKKGNDVYATFLLKKEQFMHIKEKRITGAPFFRVKRTICNKCNQNYIMCDCVKFIDPDVSDELRDAEKWGMIWTNRSAFFPDGELTFVE